MSDIFKIPVVARLEVSTQFGLISIGPRITDRGSAATISVGGNRVSISKQGVRSLIDHLQQALRDPEAD